MANSYTANVSLPSPTYVNVIHDDMDLLKLAQYNTQQILENLLATSVAIATNATIVNTAGKRFVKIYQTSLAGCLSTITGAIPYVSFTLVASGSNASTANFCLLDIAPFALSADWNSGYSVGSNLTLVWDGSRFIEVGRVVV